MRSLPSLCVLYLIPLFLLWQSWKARQDLAESTAWRSKTALFGFGAVMAVLLLDLLFTASWLHNGGSPHGLQPSNGLWSRIRPMLKWAYLAALILAAFSKKRERIFEYLTLISTFIVGSVIQILQMD